MKISELLNRIKINISMFFLDLDIYFYRLKNRIKDNFKENKKILIIFTCIWVLLVSVTCVLYSNTIGKKSIGNESYNRSVVEVNKETSIVEELPIVEDGESVSILFATYARINKGNLYIEVSGVNSGRVYVSKTVDVGGVIDNDYLTLKLNNKLNGEIDKRIRIKISSNSEVGEGVGIYYSNDKCFEDSFLKVNNKIQEDTDLCVKYLVHDVQMNSFAIGVIVSTVFFITLIAIIVLLINPKTEILFTIIALLLGLIMMVIIVPGAPPDELSLYEVTLQISNLMMGKDPYYIDEAYLKYGYMYGHYNISAGYVRFLKDIFEPLKLTGELQRLSRDYLDTYWIQYIPNAIGLTIGRLLKANMITTFYLGRLSSLIFYMVCIYITIKKAPSFKHVLGMLAIMPMFVQMSISISHDVFIISMSFLILSYFINWFFVDKEVSIKEFIFVFIVCLALAPAKVLYSFLAFLFLFVPRARFGSKLRKIIMCLIIIAPSIYQLYGIMKGPLYLFFHLVLRNDTDNVMLASINRNTLGTLLRDTVNSQEKEVVQYSFSYMFKHPLETLDIFYRTVRYKIKFWFYGSIGRSLAGDTLLLPIKLVHLMLIPILSSLFIKQEHTFSILMKILLVVLCIVIGLYAMIGMFVSWTDTGQTIIDDFGGVLVEGIQGRYFSPILPYFFVIFANKKFALPKKFEKYTILAYLFIFFEIVMYVLSYTFVN